MGSIEKEIASKLNSELYSKVSSELRSTFVKNNPPEYSKELNPILLNEIGIELNIEINQMIVYG
jgi:hypothetical protein